MLNILMKAKDLIEELQKLDPETDIVIDISSDFEEYTDEIHLSTGTYSYCIGGWHVSARR